MPSPFPGMNPYLEQTYDWEEFHFKFIGRMQEVLHGQIRSKYVVKGTRPVNHISAPLLLAAVVGRKVRTSYGQAICWDRLADWVDG